MFKKQHKSKSDFDIQMPSFTGLKDSFLLSEEGNFPPEWDRSENVFSIVDKL